MRCLSLCNPTSNYYRYRNYGFKKLTEPWWTKMKSGGREFYCRRLSKQITAEVAHRFWKTEEERHTECNSYPSGAFALIYTRIERAREREKRGKRPAHQAELALAALKELGGDALGRHHPAGPVFFFAQEGKPCNDVIQSARTASL